MSTVFSPLDVLLKESTRWRAIEVHVELTSTNDVLRSRAERGEPDGLVVVADHQTAGHGRRHAWLDHPGTALLASFLVRLPARAAPSVSFAAGLALDDALAALGAPTRLAWPNRVEIDGRTVGGVLVDVGGRDPRWFVIGMGVNVGTDLDLDPGWVSLADVLDRDIDRFEVLGGLMRDLEAQLRVAENDPDAVAAAYRERCSTLGGEINVTTPVGEKVAGLAADVDDRGALLVDDGEQIIRIPAGDVAAVIPGRPV